MGAGYRLDHSPLLLAMNKGAEGHTLHGGAVTEAGEPAWPLRFECVGGQMRNQLLTVCLQLTDAPAGAGGFCVVPGSHKSNFPIPPALADLADEELAQSSMRRGASFWERSRRGLAAARGVVPAESPRRGRGGVPTLLSVDLSSQSCPRRPSDYPRGTRGGVARADTIG